MTPAETTAPRVITFANEKGGTGKTTLAVHAAVGLAQAGHDVAALDLDIGQRSLSQYLDNRAAAAERSRMVRLVDHRCDGADDAHRQLAETLDALAVCDVVVIDTPGATTALCRAAIDLSDALVTPVNDSLVDISALAVIDTVRRTVKGPSPYTQMVWEANNTRVVDGRPPLEWIVVKNRVPHVHSRNQATVDYLLKELAWRLGFSVAPGLRERVIYRELFLHGLTVLDLANLDIPLNTPSHLAAEREIAGLIDMLAARTPALAARRTATDSGAVAEPPPS